MIEVIYEDNHLLVVNKQSGILSQGDITGDISLVEYGKKYLKDKYKKPGNVFLGLVHRLDRPVSGAIVMAKTSKALERMNRLFQERKTRKIYWAIVEKPPPNEEGQLTNWLIKDTRKNLVKSYHKIVKGSQKAELKYRLIGRVDKYYLVEINPLTGRPHQIRVQLAGIGCPIKGDVKYGFPNANKDASINLHARELEFIHPVKKEPLIIQAPLPKDPIWGKFDQTEKEER